MCILNTVWEQCNMIQYLLEGNMHFFEHPLKQFPHRGHFEVWIMFYKQLNVELFLRSKWSPVQSFTIILSIKQKLHSSTPDEEEWFSVQYVLEQYVQKLHWICGSKSSPFIKYDIIILILSSELL